MYNFHVLHWGEKYSNEYPLRLYYNIKKYCTLPFTFHVITDQKQHHELAWFDNIKFSDIEDYSPIQTDRMFTYQKTVIQNRHITGNHIILDLDFRFIRKIDQFLINFFSYNNPPTYNLTWGADELLNNWGRGSACLVNSSIVLWKDDSAAFIYDHIQEYLTQTLYMYDSTDMYLNYVHFSKNRINLQGMAMNYEAYTNNPGLRELFIGVAFPTSHAKYTGEKVIELHDTELF